MHCYMDSKQDSVIVLFGVEMSNLYDDNVPYRSAQDKLTR